MTLAWQGPVRAGAFLAGALLLVCASPAPAHEIGTTRVSVLFSEDARTYDIELLTDADSLVEKLEGDAPTASGGGRAERLSSLDRTFRRRVRIAFDGVEARPEIEYLVAPAQDGLSSQAATIRFRGAVPARARSFTWSYGWTFASYAMSLRRSAAEPATTAWLEGDQISAPWTWLAPTPVPDRRAVAGRYLTLGFTHIVPRGLDHVLFVLGIFLLGGPRRSMAAQVTAFTLAHSITLGLSLYRLVSVSPRIVEPLIAVSIAYVAIENLFLRELNMRRVALVFAFGLLHGLGFAGALAEAGLPRAGLVTALVSFNLGVEAGQLAVIGAAFALVGRGCADCAWYRSRIVIPASIAIACTGVCWTIARLA
jgi:hydrogenase/urease accessory protein HupE